MGSEVKNFVCHPTVLNAVFTQWRALVCCLTPSRYWVLFLGGEGLAVWNLHVLPVIVWFPGASVSPTIIKNTYQTYYPVSALDQIHWWRSGCGLGELHRNCLVLLIRRDKEIFLKWDLYITFSTWPIERLLQDLMFSQIHGLKTVVYKWFTNTRHPLEG